MDSEFMERFNRLEFGMRDDTSIAPTALRFSVGNLVIYKPETAVGWYEGEVVKVSQRMRYSGSHSEYIAYLVWPHRDDLSDDEIGTEWVREDSDAFIRPRPVNLRPDPAKFKPLLVVPNDPYHFLYTNQKLHDSKSEEGEEMHDLFRRIPGIDGAKANPDGSVNISMGGRKYSTATVKFPDESIYGIEPYIVMMWSSQQLSVRERVLLSATDRVPDMIGAFKERFKFSGSLNQLEIDAKTSNSKMLLLADCLMLGVHGWPRDPMRACNLYRAAAWGCTEEEESSVSGIPVGDPKAMIASASIAFGQLKLRCGYSQEENCPIRELISEGLRSAENMGVLDNMFQWLSRALFYGHITPLTLVIGEAIRDMNLINDRRLIRDIGDENVKEILQAMEYRDKELQFERMQDKGLLPRGDPSDEVLQLFQPRAIEIFRNLSKTDDTIHIAFKQVSRPPFPMVVLSFYPVTKKIVKVVRLPKSLQLTPYSLESFLRVWLLIAFDLHLGKLVTNERCRPKAFTVLDDGHGNSAFALYLKEMLVNCDTEVRLVAHSDTIKTGKRSRSTIGDITSEMMTRLLDIPGFLIDDESSDDIVARAQEEYVDYLVDQQFGEDEADDDTCRLEAQRMKERGNQYFQRKDLTSAIRCYSLALGHLRRVIIYNTSTYELLGTTLSNRAACFLGALDAQRSYSTEFRKVYARNAISDCTSALESSWAISSLPQSICEKLRFRLDKATACYDSLNTVDDFSVASVLFPPPNEVTGHEYVNAIRATSRMRNTDISDDGGERNQEVYSQDTVTTIQYKPITDQDALVEYGETVYGNNLAKNANDGCPICLREFSGELLKSYIVVLPCGEHALCASCLCTLKIQADKAKQCPQCPLCRFSFSGDFVEGIPSIILEKDQVISNLVIRLANMNHDEKIAVAESLLWTHRFDVSGVVEALEELLDGRVSGLFFRSTGDLSYRQKEEIYRKARLPVEILQGKLKTLLQQLNLADSASLATLCCSIRQVRLELGEAREKAREEVYSNMNNVGTMGAEQDGGMIQVDYHGLHVAEMRKKFKDHIVPIIAEVKMIMVITGRGSHSVGSEGKLKKALLKLIGEYENLYWQRVEGNDGAVLVLWRKKKGP